MNKELFDSMQEQMKPTSEVRAALSERLDQPVKKQVPVRKYVAVADCAALVIGVLSAYNLHQRNSNYDDWIFDIHSLSKEASAMPSLHSYVTVEGLIGYVTENAAETGSGTDTGGALPASNTGTLPNGAYVGDIPVQEGSEAYQRLMAHFNGNLPDWYGGAYLDSSGWLVVKLVEDKDPGDKSLELQVQDWAGSDHVMFTSCKYSLAHLNELMDQLNQLPDTDPKCGDIMAGWGIDEKANRIELTLTDINDHILNILFQMDPEDDAIYVQVGQRITTTDLATEDPAVYSVTTPGGTIMPVVPEADENLIAVEPYYDGAHYDLEHLPENLPESKRPAITVQSASEDASTASYNPNS